MKPLILSFYHPDIVKGGGQQVAINLHRAFVKKGIDSTFIGFDNNLPKTMRSDATPLCMLPGRINEYVCQVSSFNSTQMLSDDPWSSKASFELIYQLKPSVIYVHHFLMIGVDFIWHLKRNLPATKFIFTAHEYLSICQRDGHLIKKDGSLCNSHTPTDCTKCFPNISVTSFDLRNRLFERFFEIFNWVVTPSKYMHESMKRSYPAIARKLICIPNGSFYKNELLKIKAKKLTCNSDKKVGFFGQLLSDKGIYEYLSSCDHLLDEFENIDFDIVGGNFNLNSDEFKSKFNLKLSQLKSKKNGSRINIFGEYRNQNVILMMRKYDILVFPSKWPETFSLVFSEAIISGATVIVPNIGAFSERSKGYKDRVITYDLNEKNSLTEAIRFAIKRKINDSTPIQMGEDLTIETMAQKYLGLVHAIK